MAATLIVTTGGGIDGYPVAEYLGVVRGLVVRVPTPRQGLEALGSALSGNLQAGAEMYAEVCEMARAQAYRRMVEHARGLGADAVIAMRYDATAVGDSATEVLAYGTAVKLKYPEAAGAPLSCPEAKGTYNGLIWGRANRRTRPGRRRWFQPGHRPCGQLGG
jgi:uncharacterized protein YbjQ (UPF0145 family)